jgi:hypothetical protein
VNPGERTQIANWYTSKQKYNPNGLPFAHLSFAEGRPPMARACPQQETVEHLTIPQVASVASRAPCRNDDENLLRNAFPGLLD